MPRNWVLAGSDVFKALRICWVDVLTGTKRRSKKNPEFRER